MTVIFQDTDFIFSNAAWIILAVNGSLSAASSILIMSIIIRSSPESRTSAYHIIMFCMSIWNMVLSIAMALGTIPMPSDALEIYPFAGKMLGNIVTCEAQGLFIFMGYLFVIGSIATLNVYYVCTFRYQMTEVKLKKYVMLPIFAVFITLAFLFSASTLQRETINPSPLRGFCMVIDYPFGCIDKSDSAECIRGGKLNVNNFSAFAILFMGATFIVLVVSLTLVLASVFEAELGLRRIQLRAGVALGTRPLTTIEESAFKRTRAVLIQALMYIVAFLLSHVWSFNMLMKRHKYSKEGSPSDTIAFCTTFFTPLQGFFNAIIFVYQKAYTLLQINNDLSIFGAWKRVILSPSSVPQTPVSGMEMVEQDAESGQTSLRRRQRVMYNECSGLRRFGSSVEEIPGTDDNNEASHSIISRGACASNAASKDSSYVISSTGLNSLSIGLSNSASPDSVLSREDVDSDSTPRARSNALSSRGVTSVGHGDQSLSSAGDIDSW